MKSLIGLVVLLVLVTTALAGESGEVIITEIMPDPSAVTDANGEWFELFNTTSQDIDLNGWTLMDAGSDSTAIDNGGPLLIPAKGFLVLGRNADSATNGNYHCDYVYTGFNLGNTDDEIILLNGSQVVDSVGYDGGINWPDPTGKSMVLVNFALDNNVGGNWAESQARQGSFVGDTGDFGSPGSLGIEQTLPVVLLSFNAQCTSEGILLTWRTGIEIDNLGFRVQRRTSDATEFATISALLPGRDNSLTAADYQFLDRTAVAGQTYVYRLLDLARDGKIMVHPTIEITASGIWLPEQFAITSIYPNPISVGDYTGLVQIQMTLPESMQNQTMVFTLFNLLGQRVFLWQQNITLAGHRNFTAQLPSHIPAGVCFLQGQCQNQMVKARLMLLK